MIRKQRVTLAVALLAAAIGCRDDTTVTAPHVPSPPPAAAATYIAHGRPDEEAFVEMAREIPTFAGFYLDSSGQMVVRVTRTADMGLPEHRY